MKWLVEDFSEIAFIRLYQNCFLLLMSIFAFVLVIFNAISGFLFSFELIFFFLTLVLLLFFIILVAGLWINARSKLKGLDSQRTLKYTEFLQRRLRRAVASGVVTGVESVQALNARRLNWLARQSYIVVDNKGQLAVVVRIGRDVELANVISKEMMDSILSYFAKISNTRFSKSELVTIEHSILIAHFTSDYKVAKLLK